MWCLVLAALLAPAGGLFNGEFALDDDGDGVPDGWTTSGDAGVVQRLERVPDGDGFAARLTCTAFRHSGPASHAMLAQVGRVRLEAGRYYRFRCRVRGEGLVAQAVSVAIQDTAVWDTCGLSAMLPVAHEWVEHERVFRATRSVAETSRLQLWFAAVGTVWFADLAIEPSEPRPRRYLEALPPTDSNNLIPNSGFEAGPGGWGSVTDVPGWGGNLNRLVGAIDAAERHSGRASLRIDVAPEAAPSIYFDYFDPYVVPGHMPLAAHRGWLDVTPGATYTLSAWVKADRPGLPVRLRLYHGDRRYQEQQTAAGVEWTRVWFTARAETAQLFGAVGPDLRAADPPTGRLWLDDVQLERGETAGDWAPREPVCAAVTIADGRPRVTVTAPPGETVALAWTVSDAAGATVAAGDERLAVGDQPAVLRPVPDDLPRGFYRLAVTAAGGTVTPPRPVRFAVLPANPRDDTICGMNHAYPTAELLDACRDMGVGWFRDWSYQWRLIEPEPGRLDFAVPDAQVDRVLAHRLRVLALLPFPSTLWSTTAPEAVDGERLSVLDRVAHAPRDLDEFARYVRETVAHLRGRIDSFEIFNEPVYTQYSLPRRFGYTVDEYVRHLRVAAAAVREANPAATVIGGIQSGPEYLTAELIAAGGLEPIDALSLHAYPGMSAPEYLIEGLERLRANLAEAGAADLPLWWTEGAYYADDDPAFEPFEGWLQPLPNEALQASYTIRLNAILCGYNTRRIIYHSGTPGSINHETYDGVWFDYDGRPRRLVPALATFNELVGPEFVTRGRLPLDSPRFGYAFESDGRTVVIAWTLGPAGRLRLPAGFDARDLDGNRLPEPTLTDQPVYLLGPAGAALEPITQSIVSSTLR